MKANSRLKPNEKIKSKRSFRIKVSLLARNFSFLKRKKSMETKIISQEKNPFLNREEMVMEISSEVTPTSEEIKKEIGKDENLIIIKKVNTNFGKKKVIVEVVIYDTIEAKNKVETIPKKIRAKMAEEEKAKVEAEKKAAAEAKAATEAEKPAEEAVETPAETTEAPAEKPAEETKEEPATEAEPKTE